MTEIDLQKFFDDAVATIAEILDVEMVKILELVPGDAELLLRAGIGWKPGVVGEAHVTTSRDSQAGYTLANGGPVLVDHLPTETRFAGAPFLHEHGVVSGITTPIAGRDGRAYGVLGAHTHNRRQFNEYDVSFLAAVANVIAGAIQRRQLDLRQEIMIRELRHRSGNLFSQLLALFSQTAKNSRNIADLVPKYEARVLALANAHRLITEGGWKSDLAERAAQHPAGPLSRSHFICRPNVFLEADPTFGLSHGDPRARHQCQQAWQPVAAARPRRGDVAGQADRTGTHAGDDLDRARRARAQAPAARGLWIAADHDGDRAPAQRRGAHDLHARRLARPKLTVPLTHERWPGASPHPTSRTRSWHRANDAERR